MSEQYPQYPPPGQQGQPYGPPPQYGQPPQPPAPQYGAPPPAYGGGQPTTYGSSQPTTYGQPQSSPPAYGQQPPPAYGQQPPPAYGQQPPAYGQPPGGPEYSYPPQAPYGGPMTTEPPKKSRTALWIAIAVVLVIVLGGGFALYKFVLGPTSAERNAHVAAPAKIGPLVKSTDPDKVQTANSILDGIKSDVDGIKESIAVYYEDPDHPDQPVFVIAATADLSNPDAKLDSTFKGAGNVSNIHTVPAGDLGGTAKCGSESEQGTTIIICAWTDHGSLGAVAFIGRDSSNAEALFGQIHNAVLTRG